MSAYRFGPFRLDAARRELLRDGEPVELPPKAFDVIVYLIRQRERAVGRDELISGVWGRVDVSDNVLDQIVLRARRALGDVSEPRRYLATRPRFGFAWVGELEQEDADAEAPPDAAPAASVQPRLPPPAISRLRRANAWLIALALLLGLGVALWASWRWWRTPSASVGNEAASALVLPLDAPADAGWIRLGLMDFVAQRLRSAGMETLPSEGTLALLRASAAADTDDAALRELGMRAGVAHVIRGEARFSAGQWEVTLRSIAPTAATDAYRGTGADALDAARIAADALAAALGHPPGGVALPADTALALSLQQVDAAVLGDDLAQAERVLDALPAAHREAPAVQLRRATLRFRRGELAGADADLRRLLQTVSAGDEPQLRASVLNALGNLALRQGDAPEAERRGEEAIALLANRPPSPELGRAWTGRAIARSTQGRHAEALADFAQARVLLAAVGDRLGIARIDANVGILQASRGHFADAVTTLAAATDRLATFDDLTNELYARVALAQARLALLTPLEAGSDERRLRELVAREPSAERRRYANLTRADVLWRNGQQREADALLQEVRRSAAADGDVVLAGWAQSLAARWLLPHDPQQAEREAQAALNAPWGDESRRAFAEAWLTLIRARLVLAVGSARGHEGARAALAGFETWAERVGEDPALPPALQLARAELAAADGDPAARAAFDQALQAAEATRIPLDALRVAQRYLPWLIEHGDRARVAAVGGRIEPWAASDFEAAMLSARLHAALGHGAAADAALQRARQLAGERDVHAAASHASH